MLKNVNKNDKFLKIFAKEKSCNRTASRTYIHQTFYKGMSFHSIHHFQELGLTIQIQQLKLAIIFFV